MEVHRGEVFYADLSPVVGSEQGGIRPVLIVQNEIGNRHSPTVIAAAITSRLDKARLPTHINIRAEDTGLAKDSVVLLEQIRTLDKHRLRERAGQITPEQAMYHPRRNIITRALGTRQAEQADLFRGEWKQGDMLLLCSDGLYGVLDDREMARILREEPDLDAACEQLVRNALYGGTTDNVSVVLIRNEEGK